MDKVMLITNPGSGRGQAETYAQKLKIVLETNYELQADIWLTEKFEDAQTWASQAGELAYQTVFSLGGDGTLNQVVNGLMQVPSDTRPHLGLVPLGTANDLASVLGFRSDVNQAIDQYNHVYLDDLDVGQINDQYFTNVCAIGPIPDAVMETDSSEKNRFGFLAYLRDGIKAFLQEDGFAIEIIDDQDKSYSFMSNVLVISLISQIGSIKNMFPTASHKDGLFQLMAVVGDQAMDTVQAVFEGALLDQESDKLLSLTSKKFQVRSPKGEKLQTNVDGDQGPNLPLILQIHPSALKVWRPYTN